MKTKSSFVTNSSSSNFLITLDKGLTRDEIYNIIIVLADKNEELFKEFLNDMYTPVKDFADNVREFSNRIFSSYDGFDEPVPNRRSRLIGIHDSENSHHIGWCLAHDDFFDVKASEIEVGITDSY